MQEKRNKSKIWLVNLESSGLEDKRDKKFSKQLLGEYGDGEPKTVLFPAGYVLEHPEDWRSYEIFDSGFETSKNIVSRAVYSGIDISHLEGELLTLIDASFAEKEQREAIKSLVRNTIWRFNSRKEREIEEIFKNC